MTTRRARRRQRGAAAPSLATRIRQFATGWEGIISFSVLLVLGVLAAGVLRLSIPFPWDAKPTPAADRWGTIEVPKGSAPKLALVADVSGGASADASGAKQAIEYALQEKGTVQGAQIEVTVVEDRCDPAAAPDQARQLAQDPTVLAVISQACVESALAAKSVYEEIKLPYFTISVTAPEFTKPITEVSFRIPWNDKSSARYGASYAREQLKIAKALVAYDNSMGAQDAAGEFAAVFRSTLSGQVVDVRSFNGGSDAEETLKLVRNLEPGLVFFSGQGKAAADLLAPLRAGGYTGQIMVTDAAAKDPAYLALGRALETTYAAVGAPQRSEVYDTWKQTFETDGRTIGPYSAQAYDATQILLQSLGLVAKAKDNLALEVGRQGLAGVSRSYPYSGVTGRSGFDANGDRAFPLISIQRYSNGSFSEVAIQPEPTPTPTPLAPTATPVTINIPELTATAAARATAEATGTPGAGN